MGGGGERIRGENGPLGNMNYTRKVGTEGKVDHLVTRTVQKKGRQKERKKRLDHLVKRTVQERGRQKTQ